MITKSSNKESIILSSWKNLSHIKKEKFVNKLNIYKEIILQYLLPLIINQTSLKQFIIILILKIEVAKIRIYNIAIQNLGNDNEIKYPKSFKSDFSISFKECKVYIFDNLIYSDYLRKVLLFLINQKLIKDVPLSLKIQAKIKRLF